MKKEFLPLAHFLISQKAADMAKTNKITTKTPKEM